MYARTELKARMSAHLGMDAETCAWIAEIVRMLPFAEVLMELEFFRALQA